MAPVRTALTLRCAPALVLAPSVPFMELRRIWLAALVLCAACGGSSASAPHVRAPHAPKHGKAKAPVTDLGFGGQRLAVVPEGTFGPYRGTRPEGMMAAWAAEVSGKQSWLTL